MLTAIDRLADKWKSWQDRRDLAVFLKNGCKPWTQGYGQYRRDQIIRAMNDQIDIDGLPKGFGFRLDDRIVEYPWVVSQLPKEDSKLLDAGSTLNQDFMMPLLRRHKTWITTLAPEKRNYLAQGISYTFEDIRALSFKSDYFDTVACISTLEHVGLDNVKIYKDEVSRTELASGGFVEAVQELRRVVRSGGSVLLTVPFGKHVNHGWFQIFDEAMVAQIIEAFNPKSQKQWYFKYTPEGWVNSMPFDLREATYFDINTAKVYDDDFAAASRGLVALRLTK